MLISFDNADSFLSFLQFLENCCFTKMEHSVISPIQMYCEESKIAFQSHLIIKREGEVNEDLHFYLLHRAIVFLILSVRMGQCWWLTRQHCSASVRG